MSLLYDIALKISKKNASLRTVSRLEQGMGGSEGHAVIAADVGRQGALLKKPLKHGKSIVFFGGRELFAGQKITTGVIVTVSG